MSDSDTRVLGTYDDLANEYYDSDCHPTCANFREASRRILERWLPEVWETNQICCEVGAGKSIVAEIALSVDLETDNLRVTDSSAKMLSYSQFAARAGCTLVVADAQTLPFPGHSVDLLVASVGDPYNTKAFWKEAARVLAADGTILFTTPSYAWSASFREAESEGQGAALFKLRNGACLRVPSFILTGVDQARLIRECGLQIRATESISLNDLSTSSRSQKLLCAEGGEILSAFRIGAAT